MTFCVLNALMSNEFVVIWVMVSESLMELRMAMVMTECMGVADMDERLEVVVEDMMVASCDGTCRCLERSLVENTSFSCI